MAIVVEDLVFKFYRIMNMHLSNFIKCIIQEWFILLQV